MAKTYPTLAACDFGSSKVCVLIAEMTPEGLEVVGFGEAETHGIRKGVIVNIESTVLSLTQAIHDAENLSSRKIDHLIVGAAGAHIQVVASKGMVPIRGQEVQNTDIERVIETASAVTIPLDREVVQVVPRFFTIDGQDGIRSPRGMYGRRLEVELMLITGSITPLENIRRCVQKLGLRDQHFISNALGSARAVASETERQSGVCVVDIGAASTDIAVFQDGCLSWIRSLPIGGMHLTNDLAVGLKTNLADANRLKHTYGCSFHMDLDEEIEIPGLAGGEPRGIQRRMLATILQPRLDEILALVRSELAKEGVDESLPSGIILTGGVSQMRGVLESAERVFRLPVRIGKPSGLGGLSEMISRPAYATVAGLLQLGFEENEELQYFAQLYEKTGLRRMQARMSRWFKEFF